MKKSLLLEGRQPSLQQEQTKYRNIDQPQMHNLTPSSSKRTQLVSTISRARGKVTLFLEIINKPLGGVGEEVDIILVIVLH